MSEEERKLSEKMLLLEALHAGAATPGEQMAAGNALERLRMRMEELKKSDPPVEFQFSIHDPWGRKLFCALARRYGLRPYRLYRQKHSTVMVKASRSFINQTLWPEFKVLQLELGGYLEKITNDLICKGVYNDGSEAETVGEVSALPPV